MNETEIQIRPKICQQFSDIEEYYEVMGKIGEGQYSTVLKAVGKEKSPVEGEQVAIKVTGKNRKGIEHAVRKEMDCLKAVAPHGNVMRFVEIREDEMKFYTVVEWIDGEDLAERLSSRGGTLTPEEASDVARSVLLALRSIHAQSMVHRDIKLTNIMFTKRRNGGGIKLIDFGLAEVVKKGDDGLTRQVGTQKYTPPEMFSKREYRFEVDMWSLGVVLFIMLTGYEPFKGQGPALVGKIIEGAYTIPPHLPGPARDLLAKLLEVKQAKRITAEQALKHPYIARPKDKFAQYDMRDPAQRRVVRGIRQLPPNMKWRVAASAVTFACRLWGGPPPPPAYYPPSSHGRAPSRSSPPGRMLDDPRAVPRQGKMVDHTGTALCNSCDLPISNVDDGIEVTDGFYHAQCFVCGICQNRIEERYVEWKGFPCHKRCAEDDERNSRPNILKLHNSASSSGGSGGMGSATMGMEEICPKCERRVLSGVAWDGGVYHERCFTCTACKLPIADGDLQPDGSDPYHRRCLQNALAHGKAPSRHGMNHRPASNRGHAPSIAPPVRPGAQPRKGSLKTNISQHYEGTYYQNHLYNRGQTPQAVPTRGVQSPQQQVQYANTDPPRNVRVSGANPDCSPRRVSAPGTPPSALRPPSGGSPKKGVVTFEDGQQPGQSPPTTPKRHVRAPGAAPVNRDDLRGGAEAHPPQSSQGAFLSKFCHECGEQHRVPNAKFCMCCGVKRV